MRTTFKVLMIIALELAIYAVAASAQTTAGQVATFCKQQGTTVGDIARADVNDGLCTGMIAGWRGVIDAYAVRTPDGKAEMLIDPAVRNGQLIKIFYNYVVAHPEYENKRDLIVFMWALKSANVLTERPISKGPQ